MLAITSKHYVMMYPIYSFPFVKRAITKLTVIGDFGKHISQII